jgi:hypothetical protein
MIITDKDRALARAISDSVYEAVKNATYDTLIGVGITEEDAEEKASWAGLAAAWKAYDVGAAAAMRVADEHRESLTPEEKLERVEKLFNEMPAEDRALFPPTITANAFELSPCGTILEMKVW